MEPQPTKWETVKRLFEAALEIPAGELTSFLEANCPDSETRNEVERLLQEYRQAENFLSTPAVGRLSTSTDTLTVTPGEVLANRYKIVEFLAAGGMGAVYKAEDLDLRRFVALKFLSSGASAPTEARVWREAQAASALNHPGICTVHEVGHHAGHAFISMEFLEGQTLRELVSTGPLPVDTIVDLGIEIVDALEMAHSAGVLHRDIKPANIFITRRGHAKIMDFGIATASRAATTSDAVEKGNQGNAKNTFAGRIAGTASYMSPEQIEGRKLDSRTDLFSLGVTLYEMATGRQPFQGDNVGMVCNAVCNATPQAPSQLNPELPPELETIIQKCLAKDRESRYAEASELLTALQELKRSRDARHYGLSKNRHWLAWVAVVVVSLAAALVGVFRSHAPVRLTEKDSIVLANFANTTGDPVFSDTLRAGLLADLSQSPFLNILSDDDVSKQLRFMGHPDSPLTSQAAREVCRRAGSKATIEGTISNLGSHYVITLHASSCDDGASLGVEQAEASRREDVLSRLHQTAHRLRSTLGESLASLKKYDTPLEQATTSSLEALQAFSQAQKVFRTKGELASVPFFERALALDPNFALALSDLGAVYCNLEQADLCAKYVSQAYRLRDRVSDRERNVIDSSYFLNVTGELDKATQVFGEWKQLYPRTLYPYVNMALVEGNLGRNREALDNDLSAYAIAKTAVVYRNLSVDYISLNRFAEAKAILDEARKNKLDGSLLQSDYQLAFLQSDQLEMDRCVSAAIGHPDDESAILSSQADTETYYGRLKNARLLSRRAVQSGLAAGSKESAAEWEATAALREAEFDNRKEAHNHANAALALTPSKSIKIAVALAFARSGEPERARSLTHSLMRTYSQDTLFKNYWLPTIQSAIALGNADADESLKQLEIVLPLELGGDRPPFSSGASLYPAYLRGLAYLRQRDGKNAAREFQKIVDNRGLVWNFPLGALARLQLARAYAIANHNISDQAKTRLAYEDFLALWSHADAGSPLLQQVRKEYSGLR